MSSDTLLSVACCKLLSNQAANLVLAVSRLCRIAWRYQNSVTGDACKIGVNETRCLWFTVGKSILNVESIDDSISTSPPPSSTHTTALRHHIRYKSSHLALVPPPPHHFPFLYHIHSVHITAHRLYPSPPTMEALVFIST